MVEGAYCLGDNPNSRDDTVVEAKFKPALLPATSLPLPHLRQALAATPPSRDNPLSVSPSLLLNAP